MKKLNKAAQVLAILLIGLSMEATAFAKECEGVTMPNAVTVDGQRLVLNGMGVREATVFNVNVYVAGLYIPARSRNGQQIVEDSAPKRIVLHMVRDVERGEMHEAIDASFKKGAGAAYGSLKPRIQRLANWLPAEIEEGTVLTFTFRPGKGVEVKVGRSAKGTIEGDDFGRSFFNIWLGSNPPNASLKRGLLGGACGS